MQRFSKTMLAGLAFTMSGAFAYAQTPAPDTLRIRSFAGAFLAGRVAEEQNDLDNAINFYKQALQRQADNQPIQQNLMLALIERGRFEEALPYAEKLKTVPEVERVSRVALAVEDFRTGNYKRAQDWLKLSLESDLDRLLTGIMTAWAKQGDGDTKGATDALSSMRGPDWYGMFLDYHRALISDLAGKKDDADRAYMAVMNATDAAAAAPDTYLRAAEAYTRFLMRDGKKDDALKILDRANAFSADRIQLKALRAKIDKGEPIDAMVADPRQGAAEVLLNLAMALNRGGAEPFVKLYLQLSLALMPNNDFALMNLAEANEGSSNPADAIALYARVPENSPFRRLADMQRGLNLADMGNKDAAVTLLKTMIEKDPSDMRGYLALGGVYASKDDYKDAAQTYDEAVDNLKTPTRADYTIFYQRGIAYERLKEWPKAEPSFKKALELFPNQPQVMNYLGYSWVDKDMNLQEGLDMLKKAVDLRPNDGYIVDSLGWAYYKLGRFDEATTQLEQAVSLRPDDPVLNDHLGDAYWRVGRELEATYQWRQARDLKPDADVLVAINKKLAEGLPELPGKQTSAQPAAAAAPAPATTTTTSAGQMPAEAAPTAPAASTPAAQPDTVQPAAAAPSSEPAQAVPSQAAATPISAQVEKPAGYVVRRGQSLWSIAADRLGSGERYRELIRLNPQLRNPGRLMPGMQINLPES